MFRPYLIAAALLFVSGSAIGQKAEGGISASMLQRIEKAQPGDNSSKALFNAIASNNIDDLSRNFSNQGPVDTYFSVETPKQSIHDQQKSGRCWMFSGFNVLRANFAKAHGDSLRVEFSQAYLFFYDQLEKANLMLQGVIDCADKPMDDSRVRFFFKNPINDGGTFCGVADLAEKYGLVPPDSFIPWLEEDPCIYILGNWIIETALVAAKRFKKVIPDFFINVNIAATQLENTAFRTDVLNMVERLDFPKEDLWIELTERCKDLDHDFLKREVSFFKEHGIQVALDDYGTGYSNVSNLLRYTP